VKKIRVRVAKERDLGLFRKLWREFLVEHYEVGSKVLVDENMPLFEQIFNMYVSGEEKGVVLFVGECAVAMWGTPGEMSIRTELDPIATGWGIYVQPDQRGEDISTKFLEVARDKLKELGFKVITDSALIDEKYVTANAEKFGYKLFQRTYIYELDKE
jgi:GNAT superfamily N-acetyltransferase